MRLLKSARFLGRKFNLLVPENSIRAHIFEFNSDRGLNQNHNMTCRSCSGLSQALQFLKSLWNDSSETLNPIRMFSSNNLIKLENRRVCFKPSQTGIFGNFWKSIDKIKKMYRKFFGWEDLLAPYYDIKSFWSEDDHRQTSECLQSDFKINQFWSVWAL